jgi:class 3 adenylate cyclase
MKSYATRKSKFSGVPIDPENCPSTIHLYPSDDMKNDYTTSKPVIMTFASIGIFIFTSIVFAIYHYQVERREQREINTSTKTDAIVASLFPLWIRNKTLHKIQVKKSSNLHSATTTSTAIHDHSSNVFNASSSNNIDTTIILLSNPIIGVYPNTTVLFADIMGFTAWSVGKSPIQVFTLLETIYGAIDKIAIRRMVFKVETIGDCYVAVTGLSEPDDRHSLTMARFAKDILHEMIQIRQTLETLLGPETSDLSLRIGIHSGSTTAGVLRGEKSRFQLFGLTLNIAEQMKHKCVPGRIHISQKTADLLIAVGKSRWITQRDDMNETTGKGKRITYWLHPKRNSSTSQNCSNMDSTNTMENSENHDDEVDRTPVATLVTE